MRWQPARTAARGEAAAAARKWHEQAERASMKRKEKCEGERLTIIPAEARARARANNVRAARAKPTSARQAQRSSGFDFDDSPAPVNIT